MRKIYLLLVFGLMLAASNASAQCQGNIMAGRYADFIFPNVTLTDGVVYSTVVNKAMDIYEPTGDTATQRPVIILAHGGSFVGGNRKLDLSVDSLCVWYAKRGYVTVSIDYRLGANLLAMYDSTSAADIVCKAISDGKACIRYLVANRTTYKIDTNNIFIGGNSAGAVLYMHVGYIEDTADCSPLIKNAMANNGGIEGNSGNPGYTTKAKGIINLAGALNTVSIIQDNAVPVVSLQGDADNTVPYMCGNPLGGGSLAKLCGLGALEPVLVAKNVSHMSRVFPAQGHCPWLGNSVENKRYMKTVDSLVRVFLYKRVCPDMPELSVYTAPNSASVELFPNPATDVVNLTANEALGTITIYDQMGRVVVEATNINKSTYQLNTANLSKGMYLVKLKFENENSAPIVRRVVVQ